jgi:hypothetical protein
MGELSLDLKDVSVMIAMPVYRDMSPITVHCLLEAQGIAMKAEIPCTVLFERGCAMVEVARSACVHRFLKTDRTKLFWIDADLQWSTDAFLRMIGLSTKMKAVCGSYPGKVEPLTFILNEKLADKAPRCKMRDMDGEIMRHVFRTEVKNEALVGEDMVFFNDIRALGYEVWCDPSLELGHIGSKVYSGSLYEHAFKKHKAA